MALFLRPSSTSSAVKIVSPSKTDDPKPVSKSSPSKKGPLSLTRTRHVSVLKCPPPDQPQRQCRNILIYGSVSPIFRRCRLFNPTLAPASSRTRGVCIITLRYVSKSYHMTNSFLTDDATDSKNRSILCKFNHTLREAKQRRTSNHPSPPLHHIMGAHSLQTRNLDISPKSVPPQSPPITEATPSLPAQSVNAPVFVPKSSTPILSAATPSVQPIASPASGSSITSPSRSNAHTGWTNPAEYDEGEDPFDPFSNYQYGNGYENGMDSVTQRLQAVSSSV